jgi:hypothetical protein
MREGGWDTGALERMGKVGFGKKVSWICFGEKSGMGGKFGEKNWGREGGR